MAVDFDPTRPIYLQIMEAVKRQAVRGDIAPGAQLPSVRDMAVRMRVNPNTMARAYQELEREGFVETHRGEGTFVTAHERRIQAEQRRLAGAARDRFLDEVRGLGLTSSQLARLLEPLLEHIERHIDEETRP